MKAFYFHLPMNNNCEDKLYFLKKGLKMYLQWCVLAFICEAHFLLVEKLCLLLNTMLFCFLNLLQLVHKENSLFLLCWSTLIFVRLILMDTIGVCLCLFFSLLCMSCFVTKKKRQLYLNSVLLKCMWELSDNFQWEFKRPVFRKMHF